MWPLAAGCCLWPAGCGGYCDAHLGKMAQKEKLKPKYFYQGSVVVFGAWATWTDDYEKFLADPDIYNYCAYEPMMWAFGILVTKWVK